METVYAISNEKFVVLTLVMVIKFQKFIVIILAMVMESIHNGNADDNNTDTYTVNYYQTPRTKILITYILKVKVFRYVNTCI